MNKILNKIPSNWADIKLSTYIELINKLPSDKLVDQTDDEYNTELLEIYFYYFTNTKIADSNLSAVEMLNVVSKLNAFQSVPNAFSGKLRYNVKDISKISYNDYITFQKLSEVDPINSMGDILKLFVEKSDDIDFGNESMETIWLLNNRLKKKLQRSMNIFQISLGWKIFKMMMREKIKALFKRTKTIK